MTTQIINLKQGCCSVFLKWPRLKCPPFTMIGGLKYPKLVMGFDIRTPPEHVHPSDKQQHLNSQTTLSCTGQHIAYIKIILELATAL
jgi:hypothetical protein